MLTADRTRTQDASARRQEAAAAKAAKPSLLEPGLVESWLAGRGHSAFRGKQIRRRIFRDRLDDASRWTELPERLRAEIVAELRIFPFDVEEHRVASDGTEKLLLRLDDGHLVETVLMREQGRRTVCVSTQVGCAMGCVFCASGLLGVTRSLTAAEILGQVLAADRLLGDGERITNVVVMGIGEPLANLKNLVPVLRAMTDHHGCAIGARKITVSTIGLPKKIDEFSALDLPLSLAISLHAPNDELRTRIVPTNKGTGLDAILAAADRYVAKTGRRVTYEYVLLAGVNDAAETAHELGRLLKGRLGHVNLIPMNDVRESGLSAPGSPATHRFAEIVRGYGIVTTTRKRKGADIDAACGQLRLDRVRREAGPPVVALDATSASAPV